MTLAVYNFYGQFQADWALVSADVVLTILPVILIYLVAQRWILSGVSAGAVKG
jgi:raffinose/stachyose/melibiose transport system permease protein